ASHPSARSRHPPEGTRATTGGFFRTADGPGLARAMLCKCAGFGAVTWAAHYRATEREERHAASRARIPRCWIGGRASRHGGNGRDRRPDGVVPLPDRRRRARHPPGRGRHVADTTLTARCGARLSSALRTAACGIV